METKALTPEPLISTLVQFIMTDVAIDGAHRVFFPHDFRQEMTFTKFNGQILCEPFQYRDFLKQAQWQIASRGDDQNILCLASIGGIDQAEVDRRTFRLEDIKTGQYQCAWLVNGKNVVALKARSLKKIMGKQANVRYVAAIAPVVKDNDQ